MPRIAGVSGRSTVWLSFVSPRLRTSVLWPLLQPIVERYHWILIFPPCSPAWFGLSLSSAFDIAKNSYSSRRGLALCGLGLFRHLPAQPRDDGPVFQVAQPFEGRANDVVRVRRA